MVALASADQDVFGGAIRVWIPEGFTDVSQVRDVPDHQTVFARPETDESISIEILETPADHADENPAQFHFHTLAEDNEAHESAITSFETPQSPDLPNIMPPATVSIAIGIQRAAKFQEHALNTVNVHVAVIRLADASTDVLISYNHPVELADDSSSRTLARARPVPSDVALSNFRNVLKSFRIVDYGLFS
ncbi:hypothetical protein SeMB42_g04345 [Synchytrium endobioticum]|uniref:Ran guanine nucleotide release factor n=1 Tax=Synchytrium endobioticum TaxID=286115 RepID=A0A507DCZ8_9FUNG|nr:hypothetical protein SeMB42_g04345 [Synchytrium endobioticum]TPX49185.1 hypothetical protein SeLEV6574_g01621 [Synchytrium endobioticum]